MAMDLGASQQPLLLPLRRFWGPAKSPGPFLVKWTGRGAD